MKDFTLAVLAVLSLALVAQAAPVLKQAHQVSASWSPFEDWQVQVSSPVLLGPNALPTVGLSFNKSFPIGTLFAEDSWASRFGLGVGAQGFAPVDFRRLYLGANLGLSHYTPITRDILIDYGVRYAPLYEVGLLQNSGQQTVYHGVLGNLSLRTRVYGNSFSTLGLQAGWYFPTTGADPVFVVQPLLGVHF